MHCELKTAVQDSENCCSGFRKTWSCVSDLPNKEDMEELAYLDEGDSQTAGLEDGADAAGGDTIP
jgi:hypothetical protein